MGLPPTYQGLNLTRKEAPPPPYPPLPASPYHSQSGGLHVLATFLLVLGTVLGFGFLNLQKGGPFITRCCDVSLRLFELSSLLARPQRQTQTPDTDVVIYNDV